MPIFQQAGGLAVLTPDKINKQTQPAKLSPAEDSKATELMKKLEEQKKRKEAERRLRREQRLADMQKKQLEETERAPQEPQGPPKQSRYVWYLQKLTMFGHRQQYLPFAL